MCVYDYAITMSDENVEIRILDVLKLMSLLIKYSHYFSTP